MGTLKVFLIRSSFHFDESRVCEHHLGSPRAHLRAPSASLAMSQGARGGPEVPFSWSLASEMKTQVTLVSPVCVCQVTSWQVLNQRSHRSLKRQRHVRFKAWDNAWPREVTRHPSDRARGNLRNHTISHSFGVLEFYWFYNWFVKNHEFVLILWLQKLQ